MGKSTPPSIIVFALDFLAELFGGARRSQRKQKAQRRRPVKLGRRKQRVEIVGENQHNDDGVSRQDIIKLLTAGDAIQLVREPKNCFDPLAIAVISPRGQIGYIRAEVAETLAPIIDSGTIVLSQIYDIRGGSPGKPSRGVWIDIWEGK